MCVSVVPFNVVEKVQYSYILFTSSSWELLFTERYTCDIMTQYRRQSEDATVNKSCHPLYFLPDPDSSYDFLQVS